MSEPMPGDPIEALCHDLADIGGTYVVGGTLEDQRVAKRNRIRAFANEVRRAAYRDALLHAQGTVGDARDYLMRKVGETR